MHSRPNSLWKSNLGAIRSLDTLAVVLGVEVSTLQSIIETVPRLWKPGKKMKKSDGSIRVTNDAKPALKAIHERIKSRILRKVKYPSFLHGGIADPFSPRSIKSNAATHAGQHSLIKEDIENFYPSITSDKVYRIWKYFFNYSDEVARALTTLCTYNDCVPQGWKTSGYLANLVFWDSEPKLVERLKGLGFRYSRFVDDIAVSTSTKPSSAQLSIVIRLIFQMFFSTGFKPKRSKHQILARGELMEVTGLQVNSAEPTLSASRKNNVRAVVHQVLNTPLHMRNSKEFVAKWRRASSIVGRLNSMDNEKGSKLKELLQSVKPT